MVAKAVVVGIDGTWKKGSDSTAVKGILKAAEEKGATPIYEQPSLPTYVTQRASR